MNTSVCPSESKAGLRSGLAAIVCLLLVGVPLASTQKRMRPLTLEEVAQTWVGISEDELDCLRLVLAVDGTGRGAYVFTDSQAQRFEITSWKYDSKRMTIVATTLDHSERHIETLSGTVVGWAMELTMAGEGWKRKVSLRPERDLQVKWEKLKKAMPNSGR